MSGKIYIAQQGTLIETKKVAEATKADTEEILRSIDPEAVNIQAAFTELCLNAINSYAYNDKDILRQVLTSRYAANNARNASNYINWMQEDYPEGWGLFLSKIYGAEEPEELAKLKTFEDVLCSRLGARTLAKILQRFSLSNTSVVVPAIASSPVMMEEWVKVTEESGVGSGTGSYSSFTNYANAREILARNAAYLYAVARSTNAAGAFASWTSGRRAAIIETLESEEGKRYFDKERVTTRNTEANGTAVERIVFEGNTIIAPISYHVTRSENIQFTLFTSHFNGAAVVYTQQIYTGSIRSNNSPADLTTAVTMLAVKGIRELSGTYHPSAGSIVYDVYTAKDEVG